MQRDLPRLMLAAPASGGGKTTLTCGLLQAALDQGWRPAAFKCGPDYIDPQFHRRVVGAQSANLDLFFTDEETVRGLLAENAAGCDIALLEGVMGYYDGLSSGSTEASSYHLARATQTPVVLVLQVGGAALSLAAMARGFAQFRGDANLQGLILNHCSEALYQQLKPALEAESGLPVLGYLPKEERFRIGSRHLGLVTAGELAGLRAMLRELAATLARTLDLPRLWQIARSAPQLNYQVNEVLPVTAAKPRLAVARDAAFCFYYEENLHLLRQLGVELVEFSPLTDQALPPEIAGIYLGGGYPELYAQALAENQPLLRVLRQAYAAGTPWVAECGGFLYLQESLTDASGQRWPMLGVLPGQSAREERLRQFGYITVTAQRDNLYCRQGGSIRAHEFHYWHTDAGGQDFLAQKPQRAANWPCMVANQRLAAGFPHLYYPANPDFAANLVRTMTDFQERK